MVWKNKLEWRTSKELSPLDRKDLIDVVHRTTEAEVSPPRYVFDTIWEDDAYDGSYMITITYRDARRVESAYRIKDMKRDQFWVTLTTITGAELIIPVDIVASILRRP